jgi:hypothetical protein
MHFIGEQFAQGEVRYFRVAAMPDGLKPLARENGQFIIGHSETGHHHVLIVDSAAVFEAQDAPEGMRVLYALLDTPGELRHLRDYDKHRSHFLEPGVYMFRTDREYDPYAEMERRAAD